MKRPSFQFYPADWKNNSKLRRCSEAARGAWIDVLCLLHDSDEYGVSRWPLDELARAAGVPLKLVKELVAKDVLKGGDSEVAPFVHTPRHAGKDGEPVSLVSSQMGPCWYSSRLVRDEWLRMRRGAGTRFGEDNQPPKKSPQATSSVPSCSSSNQVKLDTLPDDLNQPTGTPTQRVGERQGDGPTSTSSSTSKSIKTLSGKPDAVDVLGYLNEKTGRAYQAVDANLKLIAARLKDATVEQCKAVVDARVAKWGSDPKMDEYLRPKTIFNATNFAQYVGELKPRGDASNDGGDAWRQDPKFRGGK